LIENRVKYVIYLFDGKAEFPAAIYPVFSVTHLIFQKSDQCSNKTKMYTLNKYI